MKVVKEGSAMQGMHNYVEVDEDHSSICKPPSSQANTYRFLKVYLQQALDNDKVRQHVLPHYHSVAWSPEEQVACPRGLGRCLLQYSSPHRLLHTWSNDGRCK